MSVILKNEDEWEIFGRENDPRYYHYDTPESYPCIAQAFEVETGTIFSFIYLEDAINLARVAAGEAIHTYNKQKYSDPKEEKG